MRPPRCDATALTRIHRCTNPVPIWLIRLIHEPTSSHWYIRMFSVGLCPCPCVRVVSAVNLAPADVRPVCMCGTMAAYAVHALWRNRRKWPNLARVFCATHHDDDVRFLRSVYAGSSRRYRSDSKWCEPVAFEGGGGIVWYSNSKLLTILKIRLPPCICIYYSPMLL